MITCSLKEIFEGVCRLRGWDPATVTVAAAEKVVIAARVTNRLRTGWNAAWWPELMLVEEREYEAAWAIGETYADGDVVWHEDAYWESQEADNTGNEPADDSDYWATPGDDWRRIISFRQTGEYEIGGVDLGNCLFNADPLVNTGLAPIVGVQLYGNGILAPTWAPDQPWVRFRPPAPAVSWTEWAIATAYAIGDLVYVTTEGVCYRANAASTGENPPDYTDVWIPVQVPEFLKWYVMLGAYADGLLEREAFFKEDAVATRELEEVEERLIDQQHVSRKARFNR